MRSLSTIGWFMCQAIGTMQLDRDASPLGLVARAWAADVEPRPAGGNHFRVDHASGTIYVSEAPFSDGPHPSLRRMGEEVKHQRERDSVLIPCPSCSKPTPKSEIDGSYPYECCNQCYWELPG